MAKLRQKLTILARKLRKNIISEEANLFVPQSSQNDVVFLEDRHYKRKRIVLLSRGCTVGFCSMCPLPNESLDPTRRITEEELISQFESAFLGDSIDNYELITIYNNGNFFFDNEIPAKVRHHIYGRMKKSKASLLVVESLPQFIDDQKIKEAKQTMGDKKLSVLIGLQSSNQIIREVLINSPCTQFHFERAVELLVKNDYNASVFLMIKPPFLNEREAIEDAINSIEYVYGLGIKDIVLCPTRVAPGTVAYLLAQTGKFSPPRLWSILEILRRSRQLDLGRINLPRVALSELKKEKNKDSFCAENCNLCTEKIIKAIEKFNEKREFKALDSMACVCLSDYQKFLQEESTLWENKNFVERVESFLGAVPGGVMERGESGFKML
ncbi:MAG: hypothetical protein ACD_28C00163G0005 [uncultured bacterium]|nr:MAG: hypothetical protein ACD_28C00163G0005 [uncultured bacterium]